MAPTTADIEDTRRTSLRTYDLSHPGRPPTILLQIAGSTFGIIPTLVFHPTRPRTIVFTYEPGLNEESTVYFWDLENRAAPLSSTDSAETSDAIKGATNLLAHRLPEFHIGERTERVLKDHLLDQASRITLANLPQVKGKLASTKPFSHSGEMILLLPGQRRYANGRDGNRLFVYSTEKKSQVTLLGHVNSILDAKFSPSDSLILSVSSDRTIRVWAPEGSCKFTWQTTGQNWVGVFDPDEKYVVATCGHAPRILCWSLESGDSLWTIPDSSSDWPRALDISPDGRWLAVGTMSNGGRIGLVDLATDLQDGKRQLATMRRLGGRDGQQSECETLQFLQQSGSASPSLAYSTTAENGVEVFDLKNDTKWRCEPDSGDAYLCGWRVLPEGRLITVYSDAIRVWGL